MDESSIRQRVDLEKNEDCFRNFPSQEKSVSPRTYCAKWPAEDLELSKCVTGAYYFNDGPAWFIQGIESDHFVQKNQCDLSKHSVFTNVAHYTDWIQKIVKRDNEQQWKDVELKCTFARNLE